MEHPTSDNKDWTWVLDRPCGECGQDVSSIDREALGGLVRANAGAWRTLLGRGDIVRQRPPVPAGQPPRWSAVEYAAHVRDVDGLGADRISLMLKKKNPGFINWDQNDAAIEGGYAEVEIDKLTYALAVNAGKFADVLDKVRSDQWDRTGTRSDGKTFTIEQMARYLYHDIAHHLADANAGIEAILEARKAEARRLAEQERAED